MTNKNNHQTRETPSICAVPSSFFCLWLSTNNPFNHFNLIQALKNIQKSSLIMTKSFSQCASCSVCVVKWNLFIRLTPTLKFKKKDQLFLLKSALFFHRSNVRRHSWTFQYTTLRYETRVQEVGQFLLPKIFSRFGQPDQTNFVWCSVRVHQFTSKLINCINKCE